MLITATTLYSLCLTLLQQEIQLEHTCKQHVVPHEAPVPERNLSPVQVSLQKAKAGFVYTSVQVSVS